MRLFQFQIGSIKSMQFDNLFVISLDVFQFQIGSIKSTRAIKDARIVYRFNSKLVRLKAFFR